jgi:hypothetical protein
VSYEEIDPIITEWAERHNLTLFTEHQDCAVRSVDIVSASGQKFQIWIDRPRSGKVAVHLWDYKKQRRDWEVGITGLAACLEAALAQLSHE